jgi:uncharacterized protein
VKLIIVEPESKALQTYLAGNRNLATSRLAVVEVSRAITLSEPGAHAHAEVDRLLSSCMLLTVSADLLRSARRLVSASLRTLDAIHLASALRIEADELLAYDARLLAAAAEHGVPTCSPGP